MSKIKLEARTDKKAAGTVVKSVRKIVLPVVIGVVAAASVIVALATNKKQPEETVQSTPTTTSVIGSWVVTSVNGIKPQREFQMSMQITSTGIAITTADNIVSDYPIKMTDSGIDVLSDNDELLVSIKYLKGEDILQFSSTTEDRTYTYMLTRTDTLTETESAAVSE